MATNEFEMLEGVRIPSAEGLDDEWLERDALGMAGAVISFFFLLIHFSILSSESSTVN